MFCHQSLRASRSSATLMIKVKTVSSSIYKACLVNRHKLWRNDFCGRLGEPSYLCLIWSILFEENQCIVHPSPPPTPHKKKLCSAEFIKGCLRGRFLKNEWKKISKYSAFLACQKREESQPMTSQKSKTMPFYINYCLIRLRVSIQKAVCWKAIINSLPVRRPPNIASANVTTKAANWNTACLSAVHFRPSEACGLNLTNSKYWILFSTGALAGKIV